MLEPYYYLSNSISVTTPILNVHNLPETAYRSMNNESTAKKQAATCKKWRKIYLMNH